MVYSLKSLHNSDITDLIPAVLTKFTGLSYLMPLIFAFLIFASLFFASIFILFRGFTTIVLF